MFTVVFSLVVIVCVAVLVAVLVKRRRRTATAGRSRTEHSARAAACGGEPGLSEVEHGWRQRADNLCGYTEFLLSQYGWMFDPPATLRLKNLITEVRRVVKAGDLTAAEQRMKELDEATDVPVDPGSKGLVPQPVGLCLMFVRAITTAMKKGMELEAEQARAALSNIENALRDGDAARALDIGNRHLRLLQKIFGERERGNLAARHVLMRLPEIVFQAEEAESVSQPPATRPVAERLSYHFSAFYPEKVGPEDIGKIIAYAHLEVIAQEVAREAARRLHLPSGAPVRAASVSKAVPRESVIKVTPDVPGLVFANSEAAMALWEDKQSVEFRFKAAPSAAGQVCRGWVHYWLEGLVLADVPVAVFVAEKDPPDIFKEALVEANARPYRTVFPSYSSRDAEIVERLETYAAAFGDEYLRDVHRLRAGQRFSDELVRFIKRADVFQLFWSENAASSEWVQFEWREALRERAERPDPYFLRPVYWTPEPALIPDELKELHFAKVPL